MNDVHRFYKRGRRIARLRRGTLRMPEHDDAYILKDFSLCEETVKAASRLLRQCLLEGECGAVSQELQNIPEFSEIMDYVRQVQENIDALSRGNLDAPIPSGGYTGDALRNLQESLRLVVASARRLTVGDFSGDAGRMGELSESFCVMGKTLHATVSRLEQQKQGLIELSENLRREIDARIAMEKGLRQEISRLEKLAATDPLTGLANRRHFFQLAAKEVERIRRTNDPACLAMLDIDYFKDLNDSFGHNVGDKALQVLARLIAVNVRPYDVVARYGGDEFIFLFPETARADAHAILERIRGSVEKMPVNAPEGEITITVSVGLTEILPADGSGKTVLERAIARADNALYGAKAKCRNMVCAE